MPPERNTPTGTSLILRSLTQVLSSARMRSAISVSDARSKGSVWSQTSQYREEWTAPSSFTLNHVLGGTLRMPENSVWGAGAALNDR